MTDAALLSDAPRTAPEWARTLAERQLAMLGELAELGLDLARAVGRQANACDSPAELQGMGLTYARVSRAVRLTIALQSKRMDDLLALEAGAAEIADDAEIAPYELRKMRVERIVERVARKQHDSEHAISALMIEAGDRLEDEDLYGDLLERPISDLVARLCRDLNLSPDWRPSRKSYGRRTKSKAASLSSSPPRGGRGRERG